MSFDEKGYALKYRKTHRKELVKAEQKRYRKNRKRILAYSIKWGATYRARVKRELFTLYGPQHEVRCSWTECQINDIDMLSLDHIDDDGNKARRNTGGRRKGYGFYMWLLKEAKARRFHRLQVLCHNHNMKKQLLRDRMRMNATILENEKKWPTLGATPWKIDPFVAEKPEHCIQCGRKRS